MKANECVSYLPLKLASLVSSAQSIGKVNNIQTSFKKRATSATF